MGNIPPKKVLNSDPGTADLVGGNDWDDVVDWMSDVDKTGPVKFNTETWIRTAKLKFRDSGNDHNYIHHFSNLAADRTVQWPLLTGNDEVSFLAHTSTFTNKTIDIVSNTLKLRQYTSMVFKVGSTYYAIKYDGSVISSGSTFETVFAAALAVKGTTYLANTDIDGSGQGLFTCSGALSNPGFSLTSSNHIVGDASSLTYIAVPQGYTGTLFRYDTAASAPFMSGFGVYEAGTPARDWTGIKLECGTGDAAAFGIIKDMQFYDTNIGIELETSGTGYINSNRFDNLIFWSPDTCGILFDQQANEISQNMFTNVAVQARAGGTTYGFKDVAGTNNQFNGCSVWDIDDTGIECNIKSTATGTMIIGGRMVGGKGHFIDQGVKTWIMDTGNIVTSNALLTPDLAKTGSWYGTATTIGNGILTSRLQAITVGTGANSDASDSTGIYRTFDTNATINSLAGIRCDNAMFRRILNCYFKTALYLNSVSNVRVFAGFVANSSAPASAADPLNALEGVALWFDSAVSANWKRYHNDSSGAGTVDDTSVAAATSTLYPVEIYAVGDSKFRIVFNGVSTDISSNIPASTTGLAFWVYMENTTGASRTMRAYYINTRTDK